MANTEDQLRKVFASRVDRVRSALEQSRQERQSFSNAEESRRQHQQEIDAAEAEMQRLPGQAAKALLTSDTGDGAQAVDDLKARYESDQEDEENSA